MIGQIYDFHHSRISTQDQLAQYLSAPVESGHTDPAGYWRSKLHDWPNLCMMARDYLAIMATSAASERSFSTGRDLLGISRGSMMPSTMQICVCLRSWYRAGIVTEKEEDVALHVTGSSTISRQAQPITNPSIETSFPVLSLSDGEN